MKDLFKRNWPLVLFSIFLIFVGFVIREFIPFKQSGDMYSFSGSIVGGCMTLIGVRETLYYNDKARRFDNRVSHKPIIIMEYDKRVERNDRDYYVFDFQLHNVGRGECEIIECSNSISNDTCDISNYFLNVNDITDGFLAFDTDENTKIDKEITLKLIAKDIYNDKIRIEFKVFIYETNNCNMSQNVIEIEQKYIED